MGVSSLIVPSISSWPPRLRMLVITLVAKAS